MLWWMLFQWTFPRNTGWMSFLCLMAPGFPGDTISGQFVVRWVGIPDCQELPVPVLTAQQHHTACAHLPTPTVGIPPANEADWGVLYQIKSAPVFSCTTHIFLSLQLLGENKVAYIIPQNLSFWEPSSGRALEGASCFGVSSYGQPRGRQELSCSYFIQSHIQSNSDSPCCDFLGFITLCWAAYWHSSPLRFCRINK